MNAWRALVMLLVMIVTVGACLIARSAAQTSDDAQASPSWDDYRVVVERSIFSRDRSPRPAPRAPRVDPGPEPDPGPSAPPPPPQSYFVLVGVSIIADEPTAFVEDRRSGVVHRLHQDDAVAERRITGITLDQVTIVPVDVEDVEPLTVKVGLALTGGVPTGGTISASPSSSGSSASSDTGSTDSADDGELSMIEKLRQRRQRQQESNDD